jgi:hypothetical protein
VTASSRALALLALPLLIVALAACASPAAEPPRDVRTAAGEPADTAEPTEGGLPTPRPNVPGDALDCGGATLIVTTETPSALVTGECPTLRVEGDGIQIDASGATIGTLSLAGDNIAIRTADLTTATLQGNQSTVVSNAIASLTVRGDGNGVTTVGDIDSVEVQGNGNVISAATVGTVDQSGERNEIIG